MLEIPHLVLGAFVPGSLYDLDSFHAGVWGQLAFLGEAVLLPLGLILLAVATRRSHTYPRWAFWILVANIVLGAASFYGPVASAIYVPAPNYLLMSLSGLGDDPAGA